MPRRVSPVNLLLDDLLPPDLRDQGRVYDKKGISELLVEVARKYPDSYAPLVKTMGDMGRNQAWFRGETFRLSDFKPTIDRAPYWAELDAREAEVAARKLPKKEENTALGELYAELSDRIQKDTNAAALAQRNSVAVTVLTGARGKQPQLRDLLSTPGFYPDSRGNVVPGFVRRSYAEGVSPSDYVAGMYASRDSIVASKRAVAQGGALSKVLSRAAATTLVTTKDCGTTNGIDLTAAEPDIRGRVLQRETAGIPAGTVITRDVYAKLKTANPDVILVRSPMTCEAKDGICGKCFGVKAAGRFPVIGDHVGITASTSIGEPIAQGSLCLAEGTLVRMADFSVRRIRDVCEGEWVLGADVTGKTFPVLVTAVLEQGLQQVFRYGFKQGQTRVMRYLESTEDHKMLAHLEIESAHNKKKFGSYTDPAHRIPRILPVGHRNKAFSAVLPRSCEVPGISEPLAFMVGFFLGNGCRSIETREVSPVVSCAEPELVKELNSRLASVCELRLVKCKRSHDHRVTVPASTKGSRGCANLFKKLLKSLGLLHKYAHEKSIPDRVFAWDNASVADLVAGYLASDGCVCSGSSSPIVTFGSVSKALLDTFSELLAVRFGIYGGSVNPGTKAGTNWYTHDAWTFVYSREDQVRKFASCIPVLGRKGALLLDLIARIPERKMVHDLGFVDARKTKVENLGFLPCFDVSVDHPDHLFVLANGLIVSNSMKHVTSGKGATKEYSGIDVISRFVESPEEFEDRAAVSTVAGVVRGTREAPHGGWYVTVGDKEHYVRPDRKITVKPGQSLEAGEVLTDGLIDPEDLLTHRGLGSARAYWADKLSQIAAASGAGGDRRNFETVARASVDHVDLDDPVEEGYLPDDRVRLSSYAHTRSIPDDTQKTSTFKAVGKYLQQPALHYTPGTKLTPKMTERLTKAGFPDVFVSEQEPAFRPVFVRLQQVGTTTDDWLASLGGSYLKTQLGDGIMRAQDTNIEENVHPVPRLAYGVGYGDRIGETGKF